MLMWCTALCFLAILEYLQKAGRLQSYTYNPRFSRSDAFYTYRGERRGIKLTLKSHQHPLEKSFF